MVGSTALVVAHIQKFDASCILQPHTESSMHQYIPAGTCTVKPVITLNYVPLLFLSLRILVCCAQQPWRWIMINFKPWSNIPGGNDLSQNMLRYIANLFIQTGFVWLNLRFFLRSYEDYFGTHWDFKLLQLTLRLAYYQISRFSALTIFWIADLFSAKIN